MSVTESDRSWTALSVFDMLNLLIHLLDNWSEKGRRRKATGTGRMRHLKIVQRRFK